jgi:5-(carboxyamino)imidazole ribonucleotide mutase
MKEAAEILEQFSVQYEIKIVSAHRTPTYMYEYANRASLKGLKVIIAGAGGAAHLPGMVASLTPLPVIGVPIQTKALNGVDSLYSIVQMPPGIPVATVAINGAKNAGLLAVKILATSDPKLSGKLEKYAKDLDTMVTEKNTILEKLGYKKYLEKDNKLL